MKLVIRFFGFQIDLIRENWSGWIGWLQKHAFLYFAIMFSCWCFFYDNFCGSKEMRKKKRYNNNMPNGLKNMMNSFHLPSFNTDELLPSLYESFHPYMRFCNYFGSYGDVTIILTIFGIKIAKINYIEAPKPVI